ncbi:MAG: cofactor-independent phosphoglycerate mutase [Planctomycetes bacterium]|nr:cofactor-independent phosphoglycerate mutase [Planctomycetota bacterium]
MKAIVLVADGAADHPVPSLGGRTPLQAARTPNIDALARRSRFGRLRTIPDGLPADSAVANLAVLGYDPRVAYTGRGVLEALSLGVPLPEAGIAMRMNLISLDEGRIASHSAGDIDTGEAREIVASLAEELADGGLRFWPGLSYRHVLTLEGGDPRLACKPPHDALGTRVEEILVRPLAERARDTARILNDRIERSRRILPDHPVNVRRRALGLRTADSIWPWSPGRKPAVAPFRERFGLRGAVISAVDLIKGIGIAAGMDPIAVPGATGLIDTNYEGKADAALRALADHDLVFIHVEGIDEAGHAGDAQGKITGLERLDERLLGRLLRALEDPVAIAFLPDHPTPVEVRSHTREPVPFAIARPDRAPDGIARFDEAAGTQGSLGLRDGPDMMALLLEPFTARMPGTTRM